MMLACTVGATCSELGDMDLVNFVETGSSMRYEHVGKSRHHACTHHECGLVSFCNIVQVEQPSYDADIVGDRHHMLTPIETLPGKAHMVRRSRTENNHLHPFWGGVSFGVRHITTESLGRRPCLSEAVIDHEHVERIFMK